MTKNGEITAGSAGYSPGDEGAWLRVLTAAIEVGIHAVDPSGTTIFYNRSAGKLDGLEPAEVVGRHVLTVFPSLSEETSSLLRVLRTRETISHHRQTYRNFRGDEVHTTNTTRPVYNGRRMIGALEVATDITEMKHLAERVVDLQAASFASHNEKTETAIGVTWSLDDLRTLSPTLREIKSRAAKVARTSSPILVYGETGTGKELLVQGIHRASPRAKGAFIAQNCAALPGALLEGILFGTVKGSFTGAESRAGLFELASGGTLFLDELNSMPIDLQAKLLRVLEDGQVRRLGDNKVIPVDVRIIAAMNIEPEAALKEGALRPDLYYRVQVITLHLPSLAERREDVPMLVEYFITMFNRRFGLTVQGVTDRVLQLLLAARWRGNVRELKHALEAAMNVAEGELIDLPDLPVYLVKGNELAASGAAEAVIRHSDAGSLPDQLKEYEQMCIAKALADARGNVAQAAKALAIPRQTLQSKMQKYHL